MNEYKIVYLINGKEYYSEISSFTQEYALEKLSLRIIKKYGDVTKIEIKKINGIEC